MLGEFNSKPHSVKRAEAERALTVRGLSSPNQPVSGEFFWISVELLMSESSEIPAPRKASRHLSK